MKVFIAGGSGAIGLPLTRALVAAGHDVAATTRSVAKRASIRAAGATPVVVDALDAEALESAVRSAAPDCVIHELTALPPGAPRSASALEPTNVLRVDGTRNLLRAAIAAGARRLIGASFAPFASRPSAALDGATGPAVRALQSMEAQILGAARRGEIEGVVLRYGLFYGPGNPATEQMVALVRRRLLPRIWHDRGRLPYIHVDDAVAATVAALDHGPSGAVYEIVDDAPASYSELVGAIAEISGAPAPLAVPAWVLRVLAPYMARILTAEVLASNDLARRELGWQPTFPTIRDGLERMLGAQPGAGGRAGRSARGRRENARGPLHPPS